jgi:hypothetical protein
MIRLFDDSWCSCESLAPSPSSTSCSSAFLIVYANLLACNDWRIGGEVTCPGIAGTVVSAGVEYGLVSVELEVEGWVLRLSNEFGVASQGTSGGAGAWRRGDIGICLCLCPCTYMSWRREKWYG